MGGLGLGVLERPQTGGKVLDLPKTGGGKAEEGVVSRGRSAGQPSGRASNVVPAPPRKTLTPLPPAESELEEDTEEEKTRAPLTLHLEPAVNLYIRLWLFAAVGMPSVCVTLYREYVLIRPLVCCGS